MNTLSLRTYSRLRKVNQTDLARMSGVTRQAVSRWFRAPVGAEINIQTLHFKHLCEGLRVNAEDLLHSLPVLDQPEEVRRLETMLLWDGLFSNLAGFSVAVVRGERVALARLVQVFGLYQASKMAGRKVWSRFSSYKQFIRPVRREQLERVWQLHQSQASS